MYLLTFIIPLKVEGRVLSFIIAITYTIVGAVVYLGYTYKSKTLQNIFGEEMFDKIKTKLKLAK